MLYVSASIFPTYCVHHYCMWKHQTLFNDESKKKKTTRRKWNGMVKVFFMDFSKCAKRVRRKHEDKKVQVGFVASTSWTYKLTSKFYVRIKKLYGLDKHKSISIQLQIWLSEWKSEQTDRNEMESIWDCIWKEWDKYCKGKKEEKKICDPY